MSTGGDRRGRRRSCSDRTGCPIPALVGRPATVIAQQAGITVPADTRVLIAELKGVGRDYPLSIEKLSPVLSFYIVADWRGRLRALQGDPALRRHGAHHVDPLARRQDHPGVRPEEARRPHRRQLADDARLDRADDGDGPGDDAGVRRLGREHHVRQHLAAAPAQHQAPGVRDHARSRPEAGRRRLPASPPQGRACPARRRARQRPDGIAADVLARRIDEFLASRGYRAGAAPSAPAPSAPAPSAPPAPLAPASTPCTLSTLSTTSDCRPNRRTLSAKTTSGRPSSRTAKL